MGCGASTDTDHHFQANQRAKPNANVQPQPPPQQAAAQPQQTTHAAQQHSSQQSHLQQQAQQQHCANDYDEEKTEIAVRDIKTTRELLQKYIDAENKVKELERSNIQQRVAEAHKALNELDHAVAEMEKRHDAAVAKCKKEKADFDELNVESVKQMFEETDYEEQLSKEKQEWIEAKNEQEVSQQELAGLQALHAKSQATFDQLKADFSTLQKRYQEQEELLAAIFKGKYGSDRENKLEAEHDFMVDRQQRVAAAKYKWTNGKNLLNYATQQLCVGCKKWIEMAKIPPQDQKARYTIVTEARNNMIAAAQNMNSAQRYLSTIDFPYCKPAEVKVLEHAVSHIYTDMMTDHRHKYVYANVYLMMYKRCHALVQWFEHVIAKTISVDLDAASTAARSKGTELRQERLNLIAAKIKEDLNQEVSFEAREEAEENLPGPAAPVEGLFKTEDGDNISQLSEGPPPEGEIEADEPFTPKPLEEIAPTPKKEDLFGDAQALFKKHQEDLQELEKNQVLNKARQEQGLEEKLRARRSRRQRQAAIESEKAAMEQI